jgi:hypothetical protein
MENIHIIQKSKSVGKIDTAAAGYREMTQEARLTKRQQISFVIDQLIKTTRRDSTNGGLFVKAPLS